MGLEEHVIDIVIQTQDKVDAGIDKATKKLHSFQRSIEKTQARLAAMSKGTYEVVLSAIDKITPAGSRANAVLRRFSGRAYNVTIGAIDKAGGKLRALQGRLLALTSRQYMVSIGSRIKGGLGNIMESVTGVGGQMAVGAGIGFGVYDTVKGYMDFEKQMSTVKAISGATADEFQQLNDKAVQMGAGTKFSATEAAQAFTYMGMAGWKTSDMLSGIEGIMNLAAASGEDLASVSDIVTDALTAFGLQASDSAKFADVLAAAATNSNTTVGMMGETFKYVAPVAGALKYSIQDTSLAIGLMANAGIKGSEAGTALRSIFTRLVSPPKEAAAAIEKLGLQVTNADGSMRPFRDVLKDLRTGFSHMSESEKASTAQMLAGQDAMSGLLALVNGSDADFDKLANAIDNSAGAAKKMADVQMDNLSGDLEMLSGDWDSLMMSIMRGGAGSALRGFVQEADALLQHFSNAVADGFDITDVLSTVAKAVTDLIDKLKALDGVGSLLAGGVLIGALYKITKQAMKIADFFKNLGQPKSSGSGDMPSTSLAKDMVVNAQNVVVNGRFAPDSGGSKGGGGSRSRQKSKIPRTTTPEPKVPAPGIPAPTKGGSIARFGKFAGRIALPLALAMGAYDVATAEDGQRAGAAGSAIGGIAGGIAGAKGGAVAGAALGSVVPGIGTAAGAAVGGLVGGIGGAFIGSEAGQGIGDAIGNIDLSSTWDAIKEGASSTWQWVTDSANDAVAGISEAWSGFTDLISSVFEPIIPIIEDVINVIVGIGAVVWEQIAPYWEEFSSWFSDIWSSITDTVSTVWLTICDVCSAAYDFITSVFAPVADFFSSIWNAVCAAASAAWDTINSIISSAWDFVVGVWGAASGWFEGAVWGPISSAVSGVYNAITSAFNNALSAVQGAWSGIVGWFESNVIGPVKAAFNSLGNIGASITGLAGSGGATPHASGGIFHAPHYGVVAENGPEAIIPLGAGSRGRGMDVFARTADLLGVDMSGNGLDADDGTDTLAMPIAGGTVMAPVAQGTSANVSIGNVTFQITGNNPDEILAAIRQNLESLTDEIGGRLADQISDIHGNQPLTV